MTTPLKPIQFCVEGFISQGLFILAGAPKIGKSWLALDICLSIAKGEKVLEHATQSGTTLYLCLEDSYVRVQNRLFELTNEPTEYLHFALLANSIGKGLEEQIIDFQKAHNDLKIVFIDTLQMIRDADESSYASDYRELSILKNLADKLEIAIVLVHHLRKCKDSDPFNMISGTTGLSGCVDGSFVLVEKERGSGMAKLYCVGRDIENQELNLVRSNFHWIVTDEIEEKKKDIFSFAIHDFMIDRKYFKGSATELSEQLKRRLNEEFHPNRLTRNLVQHGVELKSLGVDFQNRRSHGKRYIELRYSLSGDSSAGRILWAEICEAGGTQILKSSVSTGFYEGDGRKGGDGRVIDIQCEI